MTGHSRGDIIANTLDYYRERTRETPNKAPIEFKRIKNKLENTIKNKQKVLINIKDSYNVQTVVVEFEYVGDRWALGKSVCYHEGEEVRVPYTIHYSDIYCKRMNVRVIVEGEVPFG